MVSFQHAQFQRLKADGSSVGKPLKVQFNPTEYTLAKGAQIAEVPIPGLDTPILQFVRGQTETMTLDLFFDSTDKGTGAGAAPVTVDTDQFYQLIKIESGTHAPPVLLFSWGGKEFPGHRSYSTLANQQRYGFKCVVESVRQRFTFFNPQGIPLRATLTVALKEYKTLAEQIAELNLQSADHTKAHVVQRGETLSRIAWTRYGDPSDWRLIADRNELDDPLSLEPGRILEIPPNE
jgi:nucleoid-associated protein YgaU